MELKLRQKRIDFIFSIVLSAVLAWMLWEARLWPPRTRLFPWSIGFFIFALSLLKVGVSLRDLLVTRESVRAKSGGPQGTKVGDMSAAKLRAAPTEALGAGSTAVILSWIVGIFLMIWLFGLRFGSLLATFVFLKGAAKESLKMSIILSVSTYLFFLLLLESVLEVALPGGQITALLGGGSVDSFLFNWVREAVFK